MRQFQVYTTQQADWLKHPIRPMLNARSYIFQTTPSGLLLNTALIAARFFWPLWLISIVFVLPVSLLSDIVDWRTELPFSVLTPLVYVASYFACFVIVGEVSDVCLGGSAAFSKAMYKTSLRGVGRLLGTDILVVLLVVVAETLLIGLIALEKDNENVVIGILILAVLVFIAGGVLIYWFCLFTAQVVAIERKYWLSALRRSAYIVSKSKNDH